MFAAEGVPPDAYFGLVLIVLVLLGAVVMTTMVFIRNRRSAPPSRSDQTD